MTHVKFGKAVLVMFVDNVHALNWISNAKMPLIIITGLPASGKTHRTSELKAFFADKGKTVRIVSENSAIPKAGYRKNEYFEDSKKEKMVRSDLKSEAIRLLNKDDVTILDAGNYIKGMLRILLYRPQSPAHKCVLSRRRLSLRIVLRQQSRAHHTMHNILWHCQGKGMGAQCNQNCRR